MAGLILCSWSKDKAERANQQFEEACASYTRLKGLSCNSEVRESGFRIARFSSAHSPSADIARSGDDRIIVAAAGWWFDPKAPPGGFHATTKHLAEEYAASRERLLDRLQGQYLVVAAEPADGSMVVAGDQLGLFPVYMAEDDGIAWVSTSSLPLACALRSSLDLEALRALFMDRAIRSPRSVFEGIKRTFFGERLYLKQGQLRFDRVWTSYQEPRRYARIWDAADEAIDILQRTCRHIAKTWPHYVSDLTGGLDSRLVAAAMASAGLPVRATVNGSPRDYDVMMARRISGRFGWPLHHLELPEDWGTRRWEFFRKGIALVDGEKSGHIVDATIWSKMNLNQFSDVAIAADGGEIFREYFWQQEFWRIGRTSDLNIQRLLRTVFMFFANPDMNLFLSDWRSGYVESQAKVIQGIADLAPEALNTAKLDAIYIWRLSGHSGRFAGAAFPVIPSILPLVTERTCTFATALPWKFRIAARLVRHIITRAHPQLAAMPVWYGGSAEPMGFRRPIQFTQFCYSLVKKLIRKAGHLTIKSSIIHYPGDRRAQRSYDTDFIRVLEREGFLSIDNLRTKDLYNVDYLRTFLRRALESDFRAFHQLYTVVSIEVLCRLCDIVPRNQRF